MVGCAERNSYCSRGEFDIRDAVFSQSPRWEWRYCDNDVQERNKFIAIAPPVEFLKQQLLELMETWKAQTALLSNITQKSMHQAYQNIIGMGKIAIPFMLEDFCKGDYADWFWALTAITGENPISEDQAGDIEAMAEAWIKWGKTNGYLNG